MQFGGLSPRTWRGSQPHPVALGASRVMHAVADLVRQERAAQAYDAGRLTILSRTADWVSMQNPETNCAKPSGHSNCYV